MANAPYDVADRWMGQTGGKGCGVAVCSSYLRAKSLFDKCKVQAGSDLDFDHMSLSATSEAGGKFMFRACTPRRRVKLARWQRFKLWIRRRPHPMTADVYRLAGLQFQWIHVDKDVDDFSRQYLKTRLRDPSGIGTWWNDVKLTDDNYKRVMGYE